MLKTWLIIQREYITRVRKRSFLLLTLLAPLGIALLIILPLLLTNLDRESTRVLVKDESGFFQNLKDTSGIYFRFDEQELSKDTLDRIYATLGYDAFLYIPDIALEHIYELEIIAQQQLSMSTKFYIESALESTVERENLKRLGLSKKDLRIRPDIELETSISGKGKQRQEGSAFAATAVGYGMGFAIYMVLLIYGTTVMRGVMEEKTNRIVEVIVTSVKPFQLMMGKIIGIGAVGLTQFTVWVILGILVQLLTGILFAEELAKFQEITQSDPAESTRQARQMAKAYQSFQGLPFLRLFLAFVFYFLGGYLLYSAVFAAIGSLTSDDGGDVQLYTFPVTLPIVLSIIIMIIVIQQPNSSLAFWASIFPLSSPIVMPARMPFIGAFNWEVALSMGLLIIGFLFSTWIAARIYRTGILMYGKKIRPREVWHWMWRN